MTTEAERVAAGLSEAIRFAVVQCYKPMPAYALAKDYDGRKIAFALQKSDLFEKVHPRGVQLRCYALNSFGLEVRSILLKERQTP